MKSDLFKIIPAGFDRTLYLYSVMGTQISYYIYEVYIQVYFYLLEVLFRAL